MSTLNIKEVQEYLLELVLFIKDICEKHNIEYWLDGGTLLGCKRNENFIPWDDDLDIAILYNDYVKLNKILESELEEHPYYFLYNSIKPSTYWSNYLGDIRVIQDGLFPIRIDLTPVKSIPKVAENIKVDRSLANVALYYNRGKFKNKNDVLKSHIETYIGDKLAHKKIFSDFYLNNYMPENSNKKNDYIYNYIFNDMIVKKKRPYYAYDDIFPLKKAIFMNNSFSVPQNTTNYLSILYGENFLTPPSKNNQISYGKIYKAGVLSKKRTLKRLKIHFERENKMFIAKSKTSSLLRLIEKFRTYVLMFASCMKNGEFLFIFNPFQSFIIKYLYK